MAADGRLLAHEADRSLGDGSLAAEPPGSGTTSTQPREERATVLDRARSLLG